MMEEGYKEMVRCIIPKILRSKVLVIVTVVVWKTVNLLLMARASNRRAKSHYTTCTKRVTH